MSEIWKDVVGYEGLYQVSNLGKVKSLGHGNSNNSKCRVMAMNLNYKKYLQLNLYKNGKLKSVRVHRLVATAFIENIFNLQYINHINGIKTDNRVENLEWCTSSYNRRHADLLGLRKNVKGENANNVKLTQKQVDQIRLEYLNCSCNYLANKYKVTKVQIRNIVNYRNWK